MNEPGRFHPHPTRRRFVQMAALGGLAFSLPQVRAADNEGGAGDGSFDDLSGDLLRDWCDGMLKVQIHNPANPAQHGALRCPACDIIHGRCMDAVYALFARDHPAFATAVFENTRLYRRCTANGLLHGGLHYASHGVKPCVHHTFTHAKAFATLRDHGDLAKRIHASAPLPRTVADGVHEYPEIATWLAARGPWRVTVTASDLIYQKQAQQPTGGALSMLWHQQVGPLLAGSMAHYHLVEK